MFNSALAFTSWMTACWVFCLPFRTLCIAFSSTVCFGSLVLGNRGLLCPLASGQMQPSGHRQEVGVVAECSWGICSCSSLTNKSLWAGQEGHSSCLQALFSW